MAERSSRRSRPGQGRRFLWLEQGRKIKRYPARERAGVSAGFSFHFLCFFFAFTLLFSLFNDTQFRKLLQERESKKFCEKSMKKIGSFHKRGRGRRKNVESFSFSGGNQAAYTGKGRLFWAVFREEICVKSV